MANKGRRLDVDRHVNVPGAKKPAQEAPRQRYLGYSDVRLKVRNIDEKQVSNEDIKKLFSKLGELKMCRFDRNQMGQFLGSATVTFEKPADARKAIKEYHGAWLDDKILSVEFDVVTINPNKPKATPEKKGGKTLKVAQK